MNDTPLMTEQQVSTTDTCYPHVYSLLNLCQNSGFSEIVGPSQSGKTTLSFQIAREIISMTFSANISRDVWYICDKNKIDNYSAISLSVDEEESTFGEGLEMDRIQIKYMQRISDLNWWCLHIQELFQSNSTTTTDSSISTQYSLPVAIIIDDFDVLLDVENYQSVDKLQKSVLHTIALLKMTLEFINNMSLSDSIPCSVILCMNNNSKWYNDVKMILSRGFNNNVFTTCKNVQGNQGNDFYLNEHKVSKQHVQTK